MLMERSSGARVTEHKGPYVFIEFVENTQVHHPCMQEVQFIDVIETKGVLEHIVRRCGMSSVQVVGEEMCAITGNIKRVVPNQAERSRVHASG